MTPFHVLVADPPWSFDDALPGRGRGAAKHYPTLPPHEIMRFPLPPLAADAILLLWRVASQPALALDVVSAWGFVPKSEIIWVKTAKARATQPLRLAIGMGHYTRASHEACILATRGKPKVRDHGVRSVFFAPRRRHSEKPPEVHALAERLCAGPYAELFARARREGWTQYGRDLPGGKAHP